MRRRWPWHRQAEPVAETVETLPEEVGELLIQQEEDPSKGLTHILEWVPIGWASLEVDRGDGVWEALYSGRQHIIQVRYKDKQEDLEEVLTDTRRQFSVHEKDSREGVRLQRILEQFSKVEYRVRVWDEQETHWVQHSLGMERPLRRIMEKLIEDDFPEDRLLLRELIKGEG